MTFNQRLPLFGSRAEAIRAAVEASPYRPELEQLYATMPLSDAANYPPELFESFAAHGRFLRENVPWCRDLPEQLYRDQVLCHRVNDEEIADCRGLFYEMIWPLIQGKTMEEAAKLINYWCLEQATYRLTDTRTTSPLTVLRCAFGRCGEESTFTVTALRSVGIPARQVYAPKWPHCDDNHAWVELYCDGKWQYMGACEPEESLNRGWFNAAASRAMLVHSRTFGEPAAAEEFISREGCMSLWNQLPRYADCAKLHVKITENGQPLEGVLVRAELLNYAEFAPIARQLTDEKGEIALTTGLGDLHLHCVKEGRFATKKIDLRHETSIEIDFGEAVSTPPELRDGADFEMQPPRDNMAYLQPQSEDVKRLRQQKFDAAVAKRHAKEAAYWTEEQGREELLVRGFSQNQAARGAKLLAATYGNEGEILAFLRDNIDLRLDLLEQLSHKDLGDCKAEILHEAFDLSQPFRNACPPELFASCLMNPRIGMEILRPWRAVIPSHFSAEERAKFVENPLEIGAWIRQNTSHDPAQEHDVLLTTPLGLLEVGSGSEPSQHILFVAICRSLGIPARLAPDDLRPQFWDKTAKHFADGMPKAQIQRIPFTLTTTETEPWLYSQNWSLARLENGQYVTLDLSAESWENQQLRLSLQEGSYRLLTCKRMPTGALFAKEYRFTAVEKGDNSLRIAQREAKLCDLLSDKPIPDFTLYDADGQAISMMELCEGKANLLLWLEEGKEPTEHILNEMEELKGDFAALDAQIIFVLRWPEAAQNPLIARALAHIPHIRVLYDDFRDTMSLLARRMYIDPDKLPIAILCSSGLNGIYGSSGYNVGLGDLILKIFGELQH